MGYHEVEKNTETSFYGKKSIGPKRGYPVYGGVLIAQSISAALKTSTFLLKNFSISFVNPGVVNTEINYEVETIRQGKNIEFKRVIAKQKGNLLCTSDLILKSENKLKDEPNFQFILPPIIECKMSMDEWIKTLEKLCLGMLNANTMFVSSFIDSIAFIKKLEDCVDIKMSEAENNKRVILITPKTNVTISLLALLTDFFLVEVLFSTFINMKVPLHTLTFTTSVQQTISVHNELSGNEKMFIYVVECERYSGDMGKCNGNLFCNNKHILSTSQDMIARFDK